MIYVAIGHDLAGLEPIVITLRTEKPLEYDKEADSDGIMRNRGGGKATLIAEAATYDEAIELLNQFGLTIDEPSAECTVVVPDWHRIPTPMYGAVTASFSGILGGWWKDMRLEFSGLVRA
jgi:hypothetical protein